ncbi:cittilin family RiPP precursor [Nocardiopsis sp. NPDC007018]|uniref:cittilin family RiPP precursor n=1 Tax=Nocardiopsis sp. NPDC007018 TaxID=3155721 RepID=UPI0033C31692
MAARRRQSSVTEGPHTAHPGATVQASPAYIAFSTISGTAGEPESSERKHPMRRAAYRIAAKLGIIDGARLTRPYLYY